MRLRRALLVAVVAVILPVISFAQSPAASGSVTISYTFSRQSRIASNQYAIWIENENGSFVRTLFATNFAAKRAGWKARPQTLPTWIQAAGVKDLAKKDVDAISGATPKSGTYTIVWDLRDMAGRLVQPGVYKYLVEGNIFWEKRVLWTGTILIGSKPQSSKAAATYSTEGAEKTGNLLSEVAAAYSPGK